jgi:hypothetical protein
MFLPLIIIGRVILLIQNVFFILIVILWLAHNLAAEEKEKERKENKTSNQS